MLFFGYFDSTVETITQDFMSGVKSISKLLGPSLIREGYETGARLGVIQIGMAQGIPSNAPNLFDWFWGGRAVSRGHLLF